MSNEKGDTILHTSAHTRKWKQAVADAKRQIAEHQSAIRRLKGAIEVFRENARDGVPWPGDSPPETRESGK